MALTKAHNRMIDAAAVVASDWGVVADGVTDDTAAIQTMLTANQGKTIIFDGTSVLTSTITIAGNKTKLIFRNGAGFTYSTATMKAIEISGDDVGIVGMYVLAPAVFEPSNTAPTYAVVWVTGDNAQFRNCEFTNIPKAGIYFADADGWEIESCTFNGNLFYNTPAYVSGFNQVPRNISGHAAVWANPSGTGKQGRGYVTDCSISNCVQGILLADYTPAGRFEGIRVIGNDFFECLDHGVYMPSLGNGAVISSNTFVACHVPIAMTGDYHSIVGNTMTDGGVTPQSPEDLRAFTGISIRTSVGCAIANNTLKGQTGVGQAVISISNVAGGSVLKNHVISGNVVEISGSGTSVHIRIGGTGAVDLTGNIIDGNTVTSTAQTTLASIVISGNAGANGSGSRMSNNSVFSLNPAPGYLLINVSNADVTGNFYELRADAVSTTAIAAYLFSGCVKCRAINNRSLVTSAWGANVSFRNFQEATSGSFHFVANNYMDADLTKLSSALRYSTLNGSNITIHDTGAGDPNGAFFGLPGSTWSRTDGGAGTCFYVKETASTSASGWVAK
jgi:hypothetical protein